MIMLKIILNWGHLIPYSGWGMTLAWRCKRKSP